MAITANDLRRGMVIIYNGELCQVVDVEFVRPGNWRAMAQAKLKSLKSGSIFMQRYQTTEKVEEATVETKQMQYLYASDNFLHFMDIQSYDQMEMELDILGDQFKYLKEQMELYVRVYEGKAIGIELPPSVDLEVIEAPPNVKGNSASGNTKPVVCAGGHVVNVPMFIEAGEMIRVDTRTGEYLERMKK
ncbi:MAG: elongation factor P [Candidatus Riflebacteria bacterium GWC2_50_8]|nr:MAG: elongation factor P [Candidatus Riflebacteria bacterium GWC2_50_8]